MGTKRTINNLFNPHFFAFLLCSLLLVAGGASYTFAAPKAAPAEDIKIATVGIDEPGIDKIKASLPIRAFPTFFMVRDGEMRAGLELQGFNCQ